MKIYNLNGFESNQIFNTLFCLFIINFEFSTLIDRSLAWNGNLIASGSRDK